MLEGTSINKASSSSNIITALQSKARPLSTTAFFRYYYFSGLGEKDQLYSLSLLQFSPMRKCTYRVVLESRIQPIHFLG